VLRRKRSPIDAFDVRALDEPWRTSAADALAARTRYAEIVKATPKGPLRDRVEALGERVDAGVLAALETSKRGSDGARLLQTLDPDTTTARLKEAKRRNPDGGPEVEALAAQHDAVNRLWDVVDDARERLKLLDVRLGAAVARVAALSITGDVGPAEDELRSVVDDLNALAAAMGELGGGPMSSA